MKILKNIIVLTLIFCYPFLSLAQEGKERQLQKEDIEKVKKKMQVLRVGFLTKELDISIEEAGKFWPVYNEYSKKISKLHLNPFNDVLKQQERSLNVRKEYNPKFKAILGKERTNKLYVAEHEFMKVIYEKIISKQRGHHKGHAHDRNKK